MNGQTSTTTKIIFRGGQKLLTEMGNPNRLGPIVTVNKSFTKAILLLASGNQIKKLKKNPAEPI